MRILFPTVEFDQIKAWFTPDRDFVIVLIVVVVSLTGIAGSIHHKLNIEVRALEKAKDRLVASVEDATRHVLSGFPQIFDRALKLIKQADREIWVVNFALNFGKAHCKNSTVSDRYKGLAATDDYKYLVNRGYRDLAKDVDIFFRELHNKLGSKETEHVYILTLRDEAIKRAFLDPLYNRPTYRKIFGNDMAKKEAIMHLTERTICGMVRSIGADHVRLNQSGLH